MGMRRYLALSVALLAVASCGTRHVVVSAPSSCGSGPPRHAWLTSLSGSGRVLWQAPLVTRGNSVSSPVAPQVINGTAVVAQDGVVHGLSLASGRSLWQWSGGQDVYALWRWGGTVAVLTDQASAVAHITSLDAATGAVRWSVPFRGGLYGNQAVTGDGGVAVLQGGVLRVIDLATGHTRWSARTGDFPQPVAADGVVAAGTGGRVVGYSAATGAALWTARGVPAEPALTTDAGLVLVTSNVQGGDAPTSVTAIDPRTGRVVWRFDAGAAPAVTTGADGIMVATYNPRRVYLLDAATGKVRWSKATFVALNSAPVATISGIVMVEGSPGVRLVDRNVSDGAIRWSAPLSGSGGGAWQIVAAGRGLVVPDNPDRPGAPTPVTEYLASTGQSSWNAHVPTFVLAPAVAVGTGALVQSADPPYACAAVGSAAG